MDDLDTLVRANRMDLVSRWADDLAHEIKNPLHAMVINLELVKRKAGSSDPEPVRQRAEIVEAELHRVHGLVESLLRLLRPWPARGTADVADTFDALLPVLTARSRIKKIEFEHRPGTATVPMAPGPLGLVVLNLVDNAIDATQDGGRITTGCEIDADGVRITVTDSGPGLSAAVAERIFEEGVTSRQGRAGLGLALVHRLVREAGGRLTVGAAPGPGGCQVEVFLPRTGSA